MFSPRFPITVEQKCRVRMQRSRGMMRENNRGGMSNERTGRLGGNGKKVARQNTGNEMELAQDDCVNILGFWFRVANLASSCS